MISILLSNEKPKPEQKVENKKPETKQICYLLRPQPKQDIKKK